MENEWENPVCGICFKSCECHFEYVEACTTEMIRMLGLELNFNKNETPVICKVCSANLQKCSEFKTKCLATEACINSCRSGTNSVELELKKAYIKKHENKTITPSECHIACRLCMEVPVSGYISLHNETRGIISAKTMLERCFSEMDLNIIKNAVVCTSCQASLHSYFSFIKNCSDIAGKIKKQCGLSKNRPQDDSNVLQFATGTLACYKNGYTAIDICKNSNDNKSYDGIKSRLENQTQSESQELHIKGEINEVEEANHTEVEKPEFNIKHEEIDIKAEDEQTARFQDCSPRDSTGEAIHQCTICKFNTIHEHSFKKHLLLHKSVSKTMHHCEYCDYLTKSKRSLTTHILAHRNDSDISMYQCQLCTYKTILRDRLNKHMLVHKNVSEVAMYQCDTCSFESRYKGVLKRHMLSHRQASEVTMYHCETCTYKTKHQSDIKRHILTHKNASEVTTYQCTQCTYKSKLKSDLRQHMLVHKNPTYSCDTCPYKAKRRARLRQHMLIHKNASEVTMYQCGQCTYKTKHQKVLHQHMAVHKDSSEVTTYLCGVCTYRTKRKGNLNRHLLIHKI